MVLGEKNKAIEIGTILLIVDITIYNIAFETHTFLSLSLHSNCAGGLEGADVQVRLRTSPGLYFIFCAPGSSWWPPVMTGFDCGISTTTILFIDSFMTNPEINNEFI